MPITISGSTGIAGVDGSAATPAVQGTDTNTGTFFPAADTVAWATGGTERMRVNSSGNVGIGTSSPNGKLSVGGNPPASGAISGVASSGGTSLALSDNVNSSLYINHPAGSPVTFATDAGGALAFATNGTTERMRIDSSGNLLFNSGYGSVATAYGCRAWVNFNGTGTVAIRASGNVTSITDNGVGSYTVNFTNAMPDANYSAVASLSHYAAVTRLTIVNVDGPSTSSIALLAVYGDPWAHYDPTQVYLAIFR